MGRRTRIRACLQRMPMSAARVSALAAGMHLASVNVLWPKADSDHARWNSPQYRKPSYKPQQKWKLQWGRASEHPTDHSVLYRDLKFLRCPSGKTQPALDGFKIRLVGASRSQLWSQNVGCRNGILNRQIDPDTTNGRHGMRGVSNAQQARAKPFLQPVNFDGQKAYIIP